MTDPYKKDVSYSAGFFMLIAFGVGGLMFSAVLGGGIFKLMTGKDVVTMITAMGDPAYLRETQVLQTLTAVFGFLIPTVVTASFLSRKPLKLVGLGEKMMPWQLVFTILIIFCGMAVSAGLGHLSYQLPLPSWLEARFTKLENTYVTQAAGMVSFKNIPELLVSLVVLALLPAVCEEFFFRGGLQNFMYRSTKNAWVSVVVVSLIFSAVHMSGYGFLSRFALGVILGLIYQLSGNIWLNIAAHFINNGLAIVMMYTQVQAGKTIAEVMNEKSGSYAGLIAVPVVILLFVLMHRKIQQTRSTDGV